MPSRSFSGSARDLKGIVAARGHDLEAVLKSVSRSRHRIFRRETKHSVTSYTISSICGSGCSRSFRREFGLAFLVPQTVIPESHPLLAEHLLCHACSVITNCQLVPEVRWQFDLYLGCPSIPCICHQLCESYF